MIKKYWIPILVGFWVLPAALLNAVADRNLKTIEILSNRRSKGMHTESSECGGYHEWKSPNYEHFVLATYSLLGDEPDWEKLEKLADPISEASYALYEKS